MYRSCMHKVHESRNGRGNILRAERLDLGWVIVGEACLDGTHKLEDISVFKTQMLHNGRSPIFEPCPNKFHPQPGYKSNQERKRLYMENLNMA